MNKQKPAMIGNFDEIEKDEIKPIDEIKIGIDGKPVNDNDLAACKSINIANDTKYFIKFHVMEHKMFNVLSDNLDKKLSAYRGKNPAFVFRPVSKATFDLYKDYLESKSNYLYSQAKVSYDRGS